MQPVTLGFSRQLALCEKECERLNTYIIRRISVLEGIQSGNGATVREAKRLEML
jgi:hypothetical protein